VAQAVGIVGVLVPSDDLVDALAEKREGGVSYTLIFARVVQSLGEIASESMAMIKSTQGQQTCITADLSARKICVNGSASVEGENQLWYTVCHSLGCSERECWVLQNPV